MSSFIRGNCTKKNPATCRLHGKAYIERRKLAIQVQEREAHLKYRKSAEADFAASWVLKEEKDRSTTVGVYRSGVPSAPKQRGVESTSYVAADDVRPAGRQGRVDGVFASPTLGGVGRWVRGNDMVNSPDVKVRELRVDIDNTYVYSINAWEKASSWDKKEFYEEFWATGLTMREYMQKAQTGGEKFNPIEWELLVPESKIRSIKPVSAARASGQFYLDWHGKEVFDILSGKNRHHH